MSCHALLWELHHRLNEVFTFLNVGSICFSCWFIAMQNSDNVLHHIWDWHLSLLCRLKFSFAPRLERWSSDSYWLHISSHKCNWVMYLSIKKCLGYDWQFSYVCFTTFPPSLLFCEWLPEAAATADVTSLMLQWWEVERALVSCSLNQ